MKSAVLLRASQVFPARSDERKKDIKTLYELLPGLSDESIAAIYFRYWERLTIQDIANIIGRSWDYTDQLIERSIRDLRAGFVKIKQTRLPEAA